MMKVTDLLCKSPSTESMTLAKLKTLDVQRRSVLGYLCSFQSNIPGFQACMAEDVEDWFSVFH